MTDAELFGADIDLDAEIARRRHIDFMQYTWQRPDPMIIGSHTTEICNELDNAIELYKNGTSVYLIMTTPPRHGKTDMVSRFLPPHFIGMFPDSEIIVCSYAQDIINSVSKQSSLIMNSEQYTKLYPGIQKRYDSIQGWDVEGHSGSCSWVGFGGAVGGKGFHLGIVDDYFKDRAEAESQIIRHGRWDWFTDVFVNRAAPVAIMLIITTLWHVDGLVGRIEREMKVNPKFPKFVIKKFPAEDTTKKIYPSGWLFTERFPPEWYETRKAIESPYSWQSLFMCNPVKKEGARYQVDKVEVITADKVPDDIRWCRFWDLASTTKDLKKPDPDWTAGAYIGLRIIDVKGFKMAQLYLKHINRVRCEAPERDRTILQQLKIDGEHVLFSVEIVAGYKDTWANLKEKLPEGYPIKTITPVKDMLIRSEPVEDIVDKGNFFIVKGDWNDVFLSEMRDFPNAVHDDQIAAVAGGYESLKKKMDFDFEDEIVVGRKQLI